MSFAVNPLIEECKRLRKTLIPVSEKNHGLTQQIAARNTLYPFVLLLGNHSSGKSSFINHALNRKVQTTGVAPTDDSFTIIGPGEADIDRSGPALVGDPDLGFGDLQAFGPVLINHTQLKVRTGTRIKNFMIVDSPGMIDSPVTETAPPSGPIGMDRGYNFEGVCRWYAERADVILLFFDPDKPGTTGETLSILTTALVGLDHKLFILLNKADQFRKIHDFARAYGSLCWNLSKVIPRKDLPRIHTMCIPVSTESREAAQGLEPPLAGMSGSEGSSVLLRTSRSPSPTLEHGANTSSTVDLALQAGSPLITQKATAPKTFFEQGIHDLEESR
jgi:predicted GTPase